MKTAIVDSRIPQKCAKKLSELGFDIIYMPAFSSLAAPVSAHPDMLMFFASNRLFCHEAYFTLSRKEFQKIARLGYEIVTSNEEISSEYPKDILFNALKLGNIIYCKTDSVSELISRYAKKEGLYLHSVKQGYAKCSVCPVGDHAAITSDVSLGKAMRQNGIDVLMISQGHISLTGYDTGFIGGCAGSFENEIYFSGNILLHPDGHKLTEFCQKHGISAVSLSDEPLVDIGSIFFI